MYALDITGLLINMYVTLTFGQVTYQGPHIVCLLLFSLTHQHYICQIIPHHTKETGTTVHLG